MAGGRPFADGRRSSVCGWPEVVRLRMAGGRPFADGRRSSVWMVCGRLRMARVPKTGRLRMARCRLRTARGRLR